MVELPVVPGVVQIKLVGNYHTQIWNSIQHAQYGGTPPSSTDLTTLCTAIGTAWANAMAPIHPTVAALTEVICTDLASKTGATASQAMSHPGTRAGTNFNPASLAMVQSYGVNLRYRGGHPRTYWPAGLASDISNGHQWSATFLPLANTAATGWVTDINNITLGGVLLKHCTVSYFKGRDANGKPILRPDPVVLQTLSTVVHGRCDTQRRRLGKETA